MSEPASVSVIRDAAGEPWRSAALPSGLGAAWWMNGASAWLPGALIPGVLADAAERFLPPGAPVSAALEPLDPALDEAARWCLGEAAHRLVLRREARVLGDASLGVAASVPMERGPWASVGALVREGLAFAGAAEVADAPWLRPLAAGDHVTVARCGAWRDARIARVFDGRFGPGRWRVGYTWGALTLDVRSGIEVYEDGYAAALAAAPELVDWICGFSEVYDTAESNVRAGLDYRVQEVEGAGQHWQDVAVRRVLRRLGRGFTGAALLEIRGRDSGGYRLNPGQLGFFAPWRVAPPAQHGWWSPGSIEDFSICNFAVQVELDLAQRWLDAAPEDDEDALQALRVCAHPALLPWMARRARRGVRAALAAARAASLIPEGALVGLAVSDEEAALLEAAAPLRALAPERAALLDRLLHEEPLTRRAALDELAAALDATPRAWLDAARHDPARALRRQAEALWEQAGRSSGEQ